MSSNYSSTFSWKINSIRITYTTFGMGLAQDGGKAKITNFDFPLVSVDENVITLEVSVYNRRVVAMQVMKPSQNLSTPTLYCSNVNPLVF